MTDDELRQLLAQPESERLEFKRNVPKDPRRLAEAAAAFANTDGGVLVIGFDERERTAIGLANVDRDLARVDYALRSVRPPLRVNPRRFDVDGKALIVVEVPKGSRFPYRADGRVLQRTADRNVPITAEVAVRRAISRPDAVTEEVDLAHAIAEQSQMIEGLRNALGWRRQLPAQLVFLATGAVVGYILGGWDPLGLQ